jgi:hypothetical protein
MVLIPIRLGAKLHVMYIVTYLLVPLVASHLSAKFRLLSPGRWPRSLVTKLPAFTGRVSGTSGAVTETYRGFLGALGL